MIGDISPVESLRDVDNSVGNHVDSLVDKPVHSGDASEEQVGDQAYDLVRVALRRAQAAARARGITPGGLAKKSPLAAPRVSGAHSDNRDPQLLTTAVGKLLRDAGWTADVSVGGVMGRWASIVGEEIAAHCTPERFEDKVLTIRASSTAWATQLLILRSSLIKRIDEEIGLGLVQEITVLGPQGPSFSRRGQARKVHGGRGPRDTWG